MCHIVQTKKKNYHLKLIRYKQLVSKVYQSGQNWLVKIILEGLDDHEE